MKRIKLTGGGYEAEILPEFGANCISLRHSDSGATLLRTSETDEAFVVNPCLYGMPLLFPPNRIEDGVFDFAGKTYRFPINEPERQTHLHGELFRTPFEVICAKCSCATFAFRAVKERPYFDYDALSIEITYSLDENGLRQTVTVMNESEEVVPVGLGFHTAFSIPFLPNGRAEDVLLLGELGAEYVRDPERMLTVWEPLPDSQVHRAIECGTFSPHGKGVSAQYLCGEERTMRMIDKATGVAVSYEVSETYFSWLTWKPEKSDFLCLEPQSWLVNAPHASDPVGMGLKVVEPHEKIVFSARMYIDKNSAIR